MNSMDNSSFQKVRDLLVTHEAISIAVGKNPRVDEMAGALALYLHLSSLQKKVTIASPTSPLVEVSSLVGIDKVKNSLDGDGGDLIVSFPYNDNEIQKVSYTIEDGFLNIVVKAGENGLTFTEEDVQYTRGGGIPTLLFVVGTPRLSDLGELFDPETLKDTQIVNIDNKADNQGFGDIVLVSSAYSSVSEAVSQLLVYLQPQLDRDIAQNLLSGISDATQNFQSPLTSAVAFEMAGTLMRLGAQRQAVSVRSQIQEVGALQPFAPVQQRPQQQPKREQRPQQSQQQQSSQQKKEDKSQKEEEKNPAPDWLTPKVYRGPTTI